MFLTTLPLTNSHLSTDLIQQLPSKSPSVQKKRAPDSRNGCSEIIGSIWILGKTGILQPPVDKRSF